MQHPGVGLSPFHSFNPFRVCNPVALSAFAAACTLVPVHLLPQETSPPPAPSLHACPLPLCCLSLNRAALCSRGKFLRLPVSPGVLFSRSAARVCTLLLFARESQNPISCVAMHQMMDIEAAVTWYTAGNICLSFHVHRCRFPWGSCSTACHVCIKAFQELPDFSQWTTPFTSSTVMSVVSDSLQPIQTC